MQTDFLLCMWRKAGKTGTGSASRSARKWETVLSAIITRLIREIFRLNDQRLKTGLNIIVVARVAAKTSEYKDLEGAYMHLCGLHHILRESKWSDYGKVFDFVGKGIPEIFVSS